MYQYHTEPFPHQAEVFERTRDLEGYALFWEQGVGKTKPTIDTACYMYEQKRIDVLVVVAPSGVHRNWLTDEIPAHMPTRIRDTATTFMWDTAKAGNVSYKAALETLLDYNSGLVVIAISYDAFVTDRAKKFFGKLFRRRKVFFVADEAHYIKTAGSTRSRTVRTAAKYAKARRLLTGTPISQGPFDAYPQIQFVDNRFLDEKGLPDYSCFKSHFGEFIPRAFVKKKFGFDPGFDGLLDEYKNLDQLNEWLSEIGSRLTKETAGLNLPPKLYSKRYFDLPKAHREVYQALKRDFTVMLDSGEEINAPLIIVQMLRLQQITCGYVGTGDEDAPLVDLSGPNPRLGVAEEIRDGLDRPTIWWSRFTNDIDKLMDLLGPGAVRYDGRLDEHERARSKEAFQKGEVQHFVGNPQAGATGLTLIQAKHVVYYSNSFRLIDRLQSEDRAHRIGQEDAVDYIDIVANDTIDISLVNALKDKFDVASQITGDAVRSWI